MKQARISPPVVKNLGKNNKLCEKQKVKKEGEKKID